jgi:hypothetical protein
MGEDGTIPIKIVMHIPHTHVGSNKEYTLIELITGDPNYHGHLEEDEEELFPIEEEDGVSEEASSPLEKQASYFAYDTMSSTPDNDDKELKNKLEDYIETENDSLEGKNNEATKLKSEAEVAETSQDEELKEHYQKLLKWVDYIV